MTQAPQINFENEFFSDPDNPQPLIGLAVSGGNDSIALLIAACESPYAARCVTFTVNHGFRAEAKGETAFVNAHSVRLGIPCEILPLTGETPKTGLQNYAREARYNALAFAAKQAGVSVVCTAHHFDDMTETTLQRAEKMFSGQALATLPPAYGLAGMQAAFYHEGIIFVRPFLTFRRTELEQYVRGKNIVPVCDPSNEDERFGRVRARRFLQNPINQSVKAHIENITRQSYQIRAEYDGLIEAFYRQHATLSAYGFIIFSVQAFLDLSAPVRQAALATACQFVSGKKRPPNMRENFLAPLIRTQKNFTCGGARVTFGKGKILIAAELRERIAPQKIEPEKIVYFQDRFLTKTDQSGVLRHGNDRELKILYPEIPAPARKTLPVLENEAGIFKPNVTTYRPAFLQKFKSARDYRIFKAFFS